jgi:hypothetical protein
MGSYVSTVADLVQGQQRRCACGTVKDDPLHLTCRSCAQLDDESINTVRAALHNRRNVATIHINEHTRIAFLPQELAGFQQLRTLRISNCDALRDLHVLGCLPELLELYIVNCNALTALPSTIGVLRELTTLEITSCAAFAEIPDTVDRMTSLRCFRITGCPSLTMLSDKLCKRVRREFRIVDCESIVELPTLSWKLGELYICNCAALQFPGDAFESTSIDKCFTLKQCPSVSALPDSIGELHDLLEVGIESCASLTCLPVTISKLFSLKWLFLYKNESLRELPDSIGDLCCLEILTVSGCPRLTSVPDTICKLTKLQELDLSDNEQLERVNLLSEDGYSLINLVRLDISGCIHMSEIIMSRSTMINNLQTLAAGDGCNARITWVTPERNYSVSVSEIETAQGRLDEHRKTK